MADRKIVLLEAALAILEKIEDSNLADALAFTSIWDEAECDGYCLIEDIKGELGI